VCALLQWIFSHLQHIRGWKIWQPGVLLIKICKSCSLMCWSWLSVLRLPVLGISCMPLVTRFLLVLPGWPSPVA